MNELFPCLACYGQKLKSVFLRNGNESSLKGSNENEMGKTFLKSDIYDPISSCF